MPDKGIVLEVYQDSAPTVLLDVLNARMDPRILTELKGTGGGGFQILKNDPKLLANPTLLKYRNIVRVRVNGIVVENFVIQTKKTIIVGEGEAADELWEISGESYRSAARDASVFPPGGLKLHSKEDRYFNFSTPVGGWFDAGDWVNTTNIAKWNSTGNWWKTAPAEWPDAPNAMWVWDRNTPYAMPKGYCYFRYTFTTTGTAGVEDSYSLFFAVDDAAEVYLDGELLMTTSEHAWTETNRVDMELEPGTHVIGIKAYNYKATAPGGLLAAFFKVGDATTPTSAQLISYTGKTAGEWKVAGYPVEEPGWTIGDVLLQLLTEASARGVRFAQNVTPTFSGSVDSAGVAWEKGAYSFSISSNYEDVFTALEEIGCDIQVDPDTLQLNAWKKRGYDRSRDGAQPVPVEFNIGRNLTSGDETGQANIANSVMLRTPNGWSLRAPSSGTSATDYGTVETQLSTDLTGSAALALTQEMFAQRALPETSATFSFIPVPGATPFVDFNVGDYVTAPSEVPGVSEKRRVMSIAVTEDLAGNPLYAVEFDTIFKDRQTELEKWVSRTTNSSAMGGGFVNSTGTPSTVIQGNPAPVIWNVPDAPTGLAASSTGRWDANGAAVADVSLSWNPVISSGTVAISDVDTYEVWGNIVGGSDVQRLATVYDAFAFLPSLESDKPWDFIVRGISRTSGPGLYSGVVSHTTAKPNVPLPAPPAPVLDSQLGLVNFSWNGQLGGSAAPARFRYMIVQRKLVADSTYVNISSFTAHGGNDSDVTVGASYHYRFVPVDSLGVLGTASSAASITVVGVALPDVDATLSDAIDDALDAAVAAQTTADGRNRIVVYMPSDPTDVPTMSPPAVAGDLWYVLDPAGDLSGIRVYNGSAWVEYQLVADSIVVPGSVGATVIADGAITTTKLDAGAVTAETIAVGTIEANNIKAGTITANELEPTFGDTLNLSANGSITFLVGVTDANADAIAGVAGNAADTQTELNDMRAVYSFDTTAATISVAGSSYSLRLKNTGIEILQGGQPVSWWDSGQMHVPNFVGTEVTLANHLLTSEGPRTIVRAI